MSTPEKLLNNNANKYKNFLIKQNNKIMQNKDSLNIISTENNSGNFNA